MTTTAPTTETKSDQGKTGWVQRLPEIGRLQADAIVAKEAKARAMMAEAARLQAAAEALFIEAIADANRVAKAHWTADEILTAQTAHVANGRSESVCAHCGGDARACYPRHLQGLSCD